MSFCSLIKGIIPKICTLYFVPVNCVLLNLSCVWIFLKQVIKILLRLQMRKHRQHTQSFDWTRNQNDFPDMRTLVRWSTHRHPVALLVLSWHSAGGSMHTSITTATTTTTTTTINDMCICDIQTGMYTATLRSETKDTDKSKHTHTAYECQHYLPSEPAIHSAEQTR